MAAGSERAWDRTADKKSGGRRRSDDGLTFFFVRSGRIAAQGSFLPNASDMNQRQGQDV